jgi:predicted metalloprotease
VTTLHARIRCARLVKWRKVDNPDVIDQRGARGGFGFTEAQETWSATFRRAGQPYENAQLVLYTGGVNTACGAASPPSARSTAPATSASTST